jgi:hypothetical protein
MAIVTIRGTLGSGAPEIGNQIAERLHFDYVDREIIADVAKRNKWSEESTAAKEMHDRREQHRQANTDNLNEKGV